MIPAGVCMLIRCAFKAMLCTEYGLFFTEEPDYEKGEMLMKLVYDINDKPPIKKNLLYAFQQLLAIMAATLLVPVLVNSGNEGKLPYLDQSAALLGAGMGTLFYILVTLRKSPVFLGSSFAFIAPLCGACAFGYLGIVLGAVFAGAVYLIIALIIKFTGSKWVNKLLPPVVIGPTVALIGLSLCGSAVTNLMNTNGGMQDYSLIHIALGIFAFGMTVWASVKGNKGLKMIPFIVGILSAYIVGLILTLIGNATDCAALQIINLSAFDNMKIFQVPHFTFLGFFGVGNDAGQVANGITGIGDVISVFMLFAPVAFVTLAEHIADHKNLSSIINRDLITEPGLHRTLVGDGAGSIIGSIFGGCPNTTYGESIGCVAISGNASVVTILATAILAIVISFFGPFATFLATIPSCVMGGVCVALYGFIAVSGLKMIQDVDLNENRNLFVVSVILIAGVGGMSVSFGKVTITEVACALILGILTNLMFNNKKAK